MTGLEETHSELFPMESVPTHAVGNNTNSLQKDMDPLQESATSVHSPVSR